MTYKLGFNVSSKLNISASKTLWPYDRHPQPSRAQPKSLKLSWTFSQTHVKTLLQGLDFSMKNLMVQSTKNQEHFKVVILTAWQTQVRTYFLIYYILVVFFFNSWNYPQRLYTLWPYLAISLQRECPTFWHFTIACPHSSEEFKLLNTLQLANRH
jgi:hypothetical protein